MPKRRFTSTGDDGAPQLRPLFETPEASTFAKAMVDTSSGKPAFLTILNYRSLLSFCSSPIPLPSFGKLFSDFFADG